MTDDRDKPRRAASSRWDDDKRATDGRDHRKRTTPTGHRTVPDATPEPTPEDEDSDGTPLSGDDLPSDAELTGPSERVLADPIALDLWHHADHVARRAVRRGQRANDRINAVHADAGNHTGAAVKKQQTQVRVIWGLLVAIGTASGGSLIAVAKGLYEKGADEGALKIRLEHFERDLERNRLELRDLRDRIDDRNNGRNGRRRFDSQPDRAGFLTPPLPAPAPKGTATP